MKINKNNKKGKFDMQILKSNEKISVYGTLNIKNCEYKSEKNISISIENKKIRKIGKATYDFLDKQYQKFNYDWDIISETTKTTKIVINDSIIITEGNFKLYGYFEDWRGIPTEDGKKYNFHTEEIAIEELIQTIESIYDDYVCDFDTVKDGLKMIITKIEIY